LIASKLFDYDEYQNGNERLQAFTNDSGQLHHKKRISLIIKFLQKKYSHTKWIHTQLVAYTQMLCVMLERYGNFKVSSVSEPK
jgi:hypothetical protein